MNCPRCGAADFEWVCRTCRLMVPRILGDVERILSTIGRRVAIPEQLRRGLTRLGYLGPNDVQLVVEALTAGRGQTDKVDEPRLRESAAGEPTDIAACVRLGHHLSTTGRRQEGARYFARAAQATPRTPDEHYVKAGVLANIFEGFGDALRCVDEGIAQEPLPSLLILKGDLHTYFNQLDEGIDAYKRALTVASPVAVDAIQRKIDAAAAMVDAKRVAPLDPAGALVAATKAVQLAPHNFTYLFARADLLAAQNRPGEALPLLDRGMQFVPRTASPGVRRLKLRCLAALQLIEDAQGVARALIPLESEPAKRQWLEHFLRQQPPSFTREQLAAHWHEQGIKAQVAEQLQEAVEFLYRAVYANSSEVTYKGGLGLSMVLLSAKVKSPSLEEEGLALMREAVGIRRQPALLFNYAQALRMAGRLSDARAIAEELLPLNPEDPLVRKLLTELNTLVN
jgi:tetratricopeptide (TPR) repeat protein